MTKYFTFILFFLLSFSLLSQKIYPLRKDGRPTSKGIEMYVKQNESKLITEYQNFVHDSLYDVYISIDVLSQYTDGDDALGFCISEKSSSEIIITNEEKFIGYEVSMLSKYKRRTIIEANTFVKGVIFHELTHFYFNQVIMEMRLDSMYVCPEYYNFNMIPRNSFGAKFIEEGICMYVPIKIGECIVGNDYIPETLDEITDKENKYEIMYQYSAEYVKSFLDKHGIKKGIELIVGIKPPMLDEILYPDKYWNKFIKN